MKVLSLANVRSLERRARNAHDQNEQTLPWASSHGPETTALPGVCQRSQG